MKKLIAKIKRSLTGQAKLDHLQDIGLPVTRTISHSSPQLYEVTGYINPLNRTL